MSPVWRGKGTYLLTVTVLYERNVKPLTLGAPVSGTLNSTADSDLWYVNVPNGTVSMQITLACPIGPDFDLYGNQRSYPTLSNYASRACSGGAEILSLNDPHAGRWYIMSYSYRGNGTYELLVEKPSLPPPSPSLSAVGAILLIGIFLVIVPIVVISARKAVVLTRTPGTRDTRRGMRVSLRAGNAEREPAWQSVNSERIVQCPRCGASLEPSSSYCWNCNASTKTSLSAYGKEAGTTTEGTHSGICMVCKNPLGKEVELLFCPFCGSLAHSDHLLEWLHVKNYCPSCGRRLNENEVHKQIRD
jgi:uncharacterized C2H2 Zn-finger protein